LHKTGPFDQFRHRLKSSATLMLQLTYNLSGVHTAHDIVRHRTMSSGVVLCRAQCEHRFTKQAVTYSGMASCSFIGQSVTN